MNHTVEEKRVSVQIIGGAYKLVLARIVVLPIGWRRKLYKSYVEHLDKEAVDIYGGQIVPIMPFNKTVSKGFKNTEQELIDVLRWLPQLTKYRGVLRDNIGAYRSKHGLKK